MAKGIRDGGDVTEGSRFMVLHGDCMEVDNTIRLNDLVAKLGLFVKSVGVQARTLLPDRKWKNSDYHVVNKTVLAEWVQVVPSRIDYKGNLPRSCSEHEPQTMEKDGPGNSNPLDEWIHIVVLKELVCALVQRNESMTPTL
ncbi:hypothetical protein V6N12_007269 [Hibiscus sabdariffa]|uniref:Uncharacterized protein n=1 Tax=Hibiscus sabdariffa TaxID=183260 RepID=A0ABR2F190_9ROSI